MKVNHLQAGVVITRSLLVLRVEEYSIFYGKLKICDFIKRLDNEPIISKKQFYDKLKVLRNSGKEVVSIAKLRYTIFATIFIFKFFKFLVQTGDKETSLEFAGESTAERLRSSTGI